MNETENGIPYEPLNSIKDADNVSVDEDIGDDFYDNLEGMTNNKCDNYSLQMFVSILNDLSQNMKSNFLPLRSFRSKPW